MKGTGFGKRSGRNQLNIWTTFTPLFDLVQSLLLGLIYNGTYTIVWHESCPVTKLKAVRSNENVNYWPASHVSISVNGWQNAAVESQQRYSKNRQKSPSTVWRGQTQAVNNVFQSFYRGASYFQRFIHLHGCYVKSLAESSESKLSFYSSWPCSMLVRHTIHVNLARTGWSQQTNWY